MKLQEPVGQTIGSVFGWATSNVANCDRCCVCEQEVDLQEPHDFDRERKRPKHRECDFQDKA